MAHPGHIHFKWTIQLNRWEGRSVVDVILHLDASEQAQSKLIHSSSILPSQAPVDQTLSLPDSPEEDIASQLSY